MSLPKNVKAFSEYLAKCFALGKCLLLQTAKIEQTIYSSGHSGNEFIFTLDKSTLCICTETLLNRAIPKS